MRLSVVVPNFNHASVIGHSIAALAQQTPFADEIIVVNDGSTDNSVQVLEKLVVRFPTVRVVQLPNNRGAIHALNRGLSEAKGEYVYFGAADDLTHDGLFSIGLGALSRYPNAAFVCAEALVVDSETGQKSFRPAVRPSNIEQYFSPMQVADLLRHSDNWILTGTAVVRRDLLVNAGGFDPRMAAFADGFVFRRLALRHGFCFVPHLALSWQVSPTGLSRSQAANADASLRVLASAISVMRDDAVFPSWYPAIFERRWRFAICRLAVAGQPMNRDLLLRLSRDPLGRALMSCFCLLGGRAGRFAALSWLSLRERPMSFLGLIKTTLSRNLWPPAMPKSRLVDGAQV